MLFNVFLTWNCGIYVGVGNYVFFSLILIVLKLKILSIFLGFVLVFVACGSGTMSLGRASKGN